MTFSSMVSKIHYPQAFFLFVRASCTPRVAERLSTLTNGAEKDSTEGANIHDLPTIRTQGPERGRRNP